MKKKILLINKSLMIGGIETVLQTQYYTLKQDYDVNILLYKRKNNSRISDDEIDYLDQYKSLKNYIGKCEKQKRFDLIICHAQSERICRDLKKLGHTKILFVIHGMHSSKFDTGNFLAKNLRLYRKRKLYNGQNVVAVSEAVQKDFLSLKIEPNKIKTIYNPFDIVALNLLAGNEELAGENYIVWVGRISKVKNLLYLIEVFKYFSSKYILRIVGSGDIDIITSMKNRIAELGIEDRVVFEGYCENPYPLIKNAKALLLTSKSEGLPTVVIESLILNTLVFSVDIPASREILSRYFVNGLAKGEDASRLAKQIVNNLDKELDLNSIHQNFFYKNSNKEYLDFFTEN